MLLSTLQYHISSKELVGMSRFVPSLDQGSNFWMNYYLRIVRRSTPPCQFIEAPASEVNNAESASRCASQAFPWFLRHTFARYVSRYDVYHFLWMFTISSGAVTLSWLVECAPLVVSGAAEDCITRTEWITIPHFHQITDLWGYVASHWTQGV